MHNTLPHSLTHSLTHSIPPPQVPALKIFSQSTNDRVAQQSSKALRNLAAANTSISLGTSAAKSGEQEAVQGGGEGKDGRK